VPATRPPAPPAPPEPSRHRLDNGLELELVPLPAKGLLALAGRVEAGAATGAPGLGALAVEHLASAPGSPGAPPLSWSLLDSPASGAHVRWLEFGAEALPDELEPLLADVAARLRAPAPEGERWERARSAALARAEAASATPETALWSEALASLWPAGARSAAPPWGTRHALEAATPGALADFLAERLVPSGARLVLAGAFEPGTALAAVERHLGGWRDAARPMPAPAAPAPRGPGAWSERLLELPGHGRNEILVVFPGDRSRPADAAATRALLYLLGETYYAGRLGRELVEPGLVYAVWATLEERGLPGFLAVHTAAAPEHTAEVLRRIREVLARAAEGGFTADELEEARRYLAGAAARSRDGARSTAWSRLHDQAAASGLTLEQLNDAARRLFHGGHPLALVAGSRY
jgi:predicted Zn-dependent peptidase